MEGRSHGADGGEEHDALSAAPGRVTGIVEAAERAATELREQAEARMAAQSSREQRLAVAGIVLDNSSSLAELDRQVGELWAELRRRAALAQG